MALILDASSSTLCSGALINNTCNLNIPYLLTANHCYATNPQQNAANWKFTFQAWSATCSPSQNANGTTFNGSTLRARNANTDFCLVELNQMPPASSSITFAGWSRANVASPSGASITHPQGDVMKIALYNATITQQTYLASSDWRVVWSNGTVEPGSSGGPLFNSNRQIIGQVHGGTPSDICTTNDHAFFGRFDLSWTGGGTNATRLSNWLDPSNTAAMTTNTRGITRIAGDNAVCSAGTYVLQSQPPGSTTTWSSSNPNGLNINSATGFATRVNNFNGPITISANVSGGLCTAANNTRTIWVGTPTFSSPSVDGSTYYSGSCHGVCPGFHTATVSINGASGVAPFSNISWTVNPSGAVSWQWDPYTSQITFETLPYYTPYPFYFDGTATNSCGSSPFQFCFISGPNCQQGFSYSFSPNPAGEELIVTKENSTQSDNKDSELIEFAIYNSSMKKVYSTVSADSRIRISTNNFPEGQYILHVINKEGVIRKHILIKR